MKIQIFLILISVAALMVTSNANPKELDQATLVLKGNIGKELYEYYKNNVSVKTESVIVTSLGGEVEYGLMIGNDIFDRKLNVIVRDYCFSSCANYIFLAGKKKIIEKDSVLGFHGIAFSVLGGAEIEKIIRESKGDFINNYQASDFALIEKFEGRDIDLYIKELEFFRRIKAKKYILSNFSGNFLIDEKKYGSMFPFEEIVIWPSSKLLKQCYNIKNVDDRFRPTDEFNLNRDWQVNNPEARLLIGGDNLFDGCNQKPSTTKPHPTCKVTTSQGIDAKGQPTTITTEVCH